MRSYNITFLLRFIPLFLLAGCTASLRELREISPVANDFSSSLAAEYLAYSESESEQGRMFSAEYFASKGVDAVEGAVVTLDEVDKNISNYKPLSASRDALLEILRDDVKKIAPQKAARAQLLFDCWNEQERKKLPVIGVTCAEEFALAYDELQTVADNLVHGAYSKHILQFAMDRAELDDEAKNTIAEIAKHMDGHSDYALELNAHHDFKDKKTRQGRLVRARLAAVRGQLVKAGVASTKIFFAKPDLARESGSAVLLSSDGEMQDSDELDIIMTSTRHMLVGNQ